ncbi:hypothetical protein [Aliarcobacter cryaerophilus]|uniref:Uncharacterized protein n=1 Tax=Aliarcobacter cryaerophilus TaxID=28198 RepID=A0A2S9TD20_9BACT|nr:hypothetical protein [Aliarcobacter cryaerophilus]PRM96733.1 hypothetical protein CJ670_08190 [Arcobacter cryaerophilus gv. crypticus]
MSKKKSIPYLLSDYNNILEDFQIQKINCMGKDELLIHLKNQDSWLYDFYLRQKCINLFVRTGGFISIQLSDDDLYKIGVETTIKQINKRYFFDLENDSNTKIIHKILSRITNNIKNYFSPFRKINYTQFNNYLYEMEDLDDAFEKIVQEIDLEKIDRETIKIGLKKVWENSIVDMDFDMQDFQDICEKFGFRSLDILNYDPYSFAFKITKESLNNNFYQLTLVFDEGSVA